MLNVNYVTTLVRDLQLLERKISDIYRAGYPRK